MQVKVILDAKSKSGVHCIPGLMVNLDFDDILLTLRIQTKLENNVLNRAYAGPKQILINFSCEKVDLDECQDVKVSYGTTKTFTANQAILTTVFHSLTSLNSSASIISLFDYFHMKFLHNLQRSSGSFLLRYWVMKVLLIKVCKLI